MGTEVATCAMGYLELKKPNQTIKVMSLTD